MTLENRCRVILLGGAKGGCGRSTLARNLLVAAIQAGIKAIGIDLDAQMTFCRWSERRIASREKLPGIVPTEVVWAEVSEWRDILDRVADHQLAIIDTAPGIEHDMTAMIELCQRSTLVMVPTSPTHDDLESSAPWLRNLTNNGVHGAFVLNRANRRTKSYAAARASLIRYGAVSPIEIPQLEEIAAPAKAGLAVADYENSRGADAMLDLWVYARREVRL